MKKFLLLSAVALSAANFSAQVLETENFETLTIGNLTSDVTGTTAGQNGWFTYSATGGTNGDASNYQVVNDATQGKVLQITGTDAATGSRYAFHSATGDNWTNRTAGNDILIVQYKFYTGTGGGTTFGGLRSIVYDGTGTKMIAGLSYNKNTRLLSGLANYDNAGSVNNYSFNLSAVPLADNTWYSVAYTFDHKTGDVNWITPGGSYTVKGAAALTDPAEHDFISTGGTGNTVAHVGLLDDLKVTATADYAILGTKGAEISKTVLNIYPNPATDNLNVSAGKILSIEIFDMAGKSLKVQKSSETKVNVSNLLPGIYLIKVTSASGVTSQKFIKK